MPKTEENIIDEIYKDVVTEKKIKKEDKDIKIPKLNLEAYASLIAEPDTIVKQKEPKFKGEQVDRIANQAKAKIRKRFNKHIDWLFEDISKYLETNFEKELIHSYEWVKKRSKLLFDYRSYYGVCCHCSTG